MRAQCANATSSSAVAGTRVPLEIDRPPWLQGESLLPLAVGAAEEIHDAVYAEGTYHVAYEPQRAIRTSRWKYIRRFGDRTLPVPANTDDSPSKDVWLESGWLDRPIAPEPLYDLVRDPNELVNLGGDAAYGQVLGDLRARLEKWMRSTGDPLCDGPVPPPRGAEFNLPDQLSAAEPTRIAT